ncbi:MAG: GntR family transcriptional regulator [Rhizobiales bacterium]|nr:GntR family transcriptional regulator [Hyphomicrobiales bacterium]
MALNKTDKIVEELEHLILMGEFEAGERLDEIKLAERFGVSRTPIREVFQKLALSGLIEQLPRRGVFVKQPAPLELLEMFEVMSELEALCGRFAAERISEDALTLLSLENEKCKKAVEDNDEAAYYDHNKTFHQIIYKESGNSFLMQETIRLQRRLGPYRRIQLHVRGRMKQSMAEHIAIVQALVDGDANRAEAALRSHVAIQGQKFQHLLANL